ncbi:terminase large subunit domain-containing protein [Herbidospora mongoliensis]|uniref:terminase large subunit domain-containing protein n=1 Tax=Herbidospora mongoliensis TaxID=688067 RepID=UPI00082C9CD8|nr:terminase large subunit [Herbidospora mongoliensis]
MGRPAIRSIAYVLAPVFGWVKKNRAGEWVRVVRQLYVDIPRKNGKSTLCGGIAMYLTAADGEPGAQVLAAATTREQAGFVFDPIKQLAEHAPALKGHVKPLAAKIIHPASGSYFKVIASAADAQHGGNIHGGVVDELHLHKTGLLVEAIETGTGSRRQPSSPRCRRRMLPVATRPSNGFDAKASNRSGSCPGRWSSTSARCAP